MNKGNPLDDFDLIVASCAIAHNLVLVINHIEHFKKIESLNLDNWTVS